MATIWTNFTDGESGLSVRSKINTFNAGIQSDMEAREALTLDIGWADYNDSTTATTPISVTGGAGYVDITNDGAGVYSNSAYLPVGVTDIWNTTTNLFDFSSMKLGDMIDIRLDLDITTTAVNQEVDVVLELGIGGNSYDIPFASSDRKSTGLYNINQFNGIYIGDNNTLNNGGKFKIQSDGDLTVKVNGWYCKIISI